MFQKAVDDLDSADTAALILDVTISNTGTSHKHLTFKQLILGVRIVLRLKKATTPPRVPSYVTVHIPEVDEDETKDKKQKLKRIVKQKDLKALEEFGGVGAAFSLLRSEPQGTANDGLELSARGPGLWDSFFLFSREFWYSSWHSLNSYTIFFLLIAAGLSLAIGSLEQGLKYGWHDGVGILVSVFVLVFFPSVVSYHRKRVEKKELLKIKNSEVSVERGGIRRVVSVSDVKEGETIHLQKGDRVPADGLLKSGTNLILDDVINPKIDPDRNPFLLSGSVVKCGEGVMIAVATGADTAFGEGLLDATVHPSQEMLLESQIDQPYKFIDKFALVVSLMILIVILTRLICVKHGDYYNDKPETKGKVTNGLMANVFQRIFLKSAGRVSFLATVLLTMVIGIQHGMPITITVSLCWWREKIRSCGGKPQNLSACGTMGLVSAICIDITGELSFREVEIDEIFIGKEKINRDMKLDPNILECFEQAARVLFFDSKTSVHLGKILLSSLANSGLGTNTESLDQKFEIIDHKILSSEKGIGVSMRKNGDFGANLHLHYNGDALTILNMCSQYYDIRGRIHDIQNQRDFLEKVISDMTIKGLIPIAFACRQTNHQVIEEGELKLLGFMGLQYSCQNIKMTLNDLKDHGLRIVLISEDELSVATTMANDLGIQCGSDNMVVEGERIREIMDTGIEINQLMESITVMGKATPEDKLLLLQGLKAGGHVVAFLGGLTTSDAPTLREADVGMTQENWSTEASQTVSDLNVEAATYLKPILRSGRCAYLNIQKFYRIQLTASISGLLITLVCTMISGKSPITTIHLIWVTLIMSLLGGLMMVMELNDEEVKIPLEGNRNQSLITKVIWKKTVIHVLFQVLVFPLSEYLGQKFPLPSMEEDVRHTMIFNTFIICQIYHLLGAMGLATEGVVVFKALLKSHWFLISLVGVLAVQMMVIEFAASIVNGVKLSAVQWAICFLFASLPLTLEWAPGIFSTVLATFFSEFDLINFYFLLMFFASLMFVLVSYGFTFSH